ncbi:MAG: hypothetical protein K0R66_503 [Gammaproteobacteria bacterium]|nr:hypothetical protein [Gammaproteobacteria bacterium]
MTDDRDRDLWTAAFIGDFDKFQALFTHADANRFWEGITLLHAVVRGEWSMGTPRALNSDMILYPLTESAAERKAITRTLLNAGANIHAAARRDAVDVEWSIGNQTLYQMTHDRSLSRRLIATFAPDFASMGLVYDPRESRKVIDKATSTCCIM